MENQEEFREFCVEQVLRLGVFPKFEFYDTITRREYRRWLEQKCATRANVQRVMDAAVELDAIPTIADLNRLFESHCEAVKTGNEAKANCSQCHGTGWQFVDRVQASGVLRCTCGVPPAADAHREYPADLGIRKGV